MTAVHGTGEGAIRATGEPDRLPDGSVGPAGDRTPRSGRIGAAPEGQIRHDVTGAG